MIRVDFLFPGTPVVVEVLGYRWHRTGAQLRIDTERANALMLRGFVPLQFTYAQIVENPESVVSAIRVALDRHKPSLF
jgi:very-short-patch-repair endonuclease